MLVGTMVGHFAGMGLDHAVGAHGPWLPVACSVLLEALIGARYGAARVGHPLTRSQRGRLSVYYSLALVAVSLPLAGWLVAAKATREDSPAAPLSSHDLAIGALVLAGGLVVCTAVRYGLMSVFSPASPRSA
jgi:hypothetical protein